MMKRILLFLFLPAALFSQKSLTVFDCFNRMDSVFPTVIIDDYYGQQMEILRKKINSAWYPAINLNAQTTYQSDVTKLDIEFPPAFNIDMDEPDKDQYKVSLDINQVIYDGGKYSSLKEIESINSEINKQNNKIELYKYKLQISDIFFGIIKMKKTRSILEISTGEINEQLKILESGIKNGIITESSLDELKAELLKLEQNIAEIEYNLNSFYLILNTLLDTQISDSTEFTLPSSFSENAENSRPEYKLFELNKQKLDISSELLQKNHYPVLFGFGQLGYGKPGLNMFKDEFQPYYIIGVKFTWNFWDWNRTKYDRQIIETNKLIIESQSEAFDKNIQSALLKENANKEKFETALATDSEIIKLREKITKNSSVQLQNGVLRATDYLSDLNKESIAKINFEIHKIELVQSQVNYKIIQGI